MATMEDLEDPEFVAYLKARFPGPLKPDPEDFAPVSYPTTDDKLAEAYRLAQASKLLRLCEEWRSRRGPSGGGELLPFKVTP